MYEAGESSQEFREGSSGGRVWFLNRERWTFKKLEAVTARNMYSSSCTRQVRKMEFGSTPAPAAPGSALRRQTLLAVASLFFFSFLFLGFSAFHLFRRCAHT